MKSSRRFRRVALGVVGGVLLIAGAARAQGRLEIELLDRGKPVSNTSVSALELGGLLSQGKPVGTTNSSGLALLDLGKVSFQPGSRVEVWIRTCQGRQEVVLVPEGTNSRCDDERTPAEARCGCQRLGAFTWSSGGGRLVVDVGTRSVTYRPTVAVGRTERTTGMRQTLSLGGGIGFFPNLKEAIEDQDGLTGMTGGTSGLTMFIGYELQPSRLPLTFGARLGCTHFGEFEQQFSGLGGGPMRSVLDFDILTVGTQVGFHPHTPGPLDFFGQLELLMAFNKVDLSTFYSGVQDPVTGRRSESGLRVGATVGADWSLTGRAGLRAMAGYTRGAGKDADTNLSFGLGFRYNIARRPF